MVIQKLHQDTCEGHIIKWTTSGEHPVGIKVHDAHILGAISISFASGLPEDPVHSSCRKFKNKPKVNHLHIFDIV